MLKWIVVILYFLISGRIVPETLLDRIPEISGYGVTEITGLQKLRERLVTSGNCSVGNLYSQKILDIIQSIYSIDLFNLLIQVIQFI